MVDRQHEVFCCAPPDNRCMSNDGPVLGGSFSAYVCNLVCVRVWFLRGLPKRARMTIPLQKTEGHDLYDYLETSNDTCSFRAKKNIPRNIYGRLKMGTMMSQEANK